MAAAGAAAEETIRAWFDQDGWPLEADELRVELQARGASEALVAELVGGGPLEEREPEAEVAAVELFVAAAASRRTASTPAAPTARASSCSSNGSLVPAVRRAEVVPITDAPSAEGVPPQNLQAEESVLGAMLLSQSAIAACSEILDPSDFYRPSHAAIFRAALALDAASEPVDAITLTDALEQAGELEGVGGRVRLHELAALVPATANAAHYARIVQETATLRRVIAAGGEIARLGWERAGEAGEIVDQAQQITHSLGDRAADDRTEHVSVSVQETFARMSERAEAGSEYIGVPSGLRALDEMTSGFEAGNLILLAARPSMGKSGLLHTIVANIAVRQKLPVLLFTAEMSKSEVIQRLLSREGRVDGMRLRKARELRDDEWSRLARAADNLSKAPLHLDDTGGLRLSYIRAKARRLKQRHPDLALVAVDYIQLLTGEQGGRKSDTRNDEVSSLSRGLKMLARELQVPVLALSQLNRAVETRTDKRPVLSDLRDSGSLEQDADLVMFLYRDDYYHPESEAQGVAELNLAKHRNGPTANVKLAFQKAYASFSDLAAVERLPGDMGAAA